MLSRLDHPVWMTVDEADEKLYPNSYIMIHCEVDTGLTTAGYLVAYAPLKNGGGT